MKQFVIATMSYHTGKIDQKKVSAVDELEALRTHYNKHEFDMSGDELSTEEIYERFFDTDMLVSVFEL